MMTNHRKHPSRSGTEKRSMVGGLANPSRRRRQEGRHGVKQNQRSGDTLASSLRIVLEDIMTTYELFGYESLRTVTGGALSSKEERALPRARLQDRNPEREVIIEKSLVRWLENSSEVGYLKFTKYKLAAFFSSWSEQVFSNIPVKPFKAVDKPEILLGGSAGRWVRLFHKKSKQSEEHRVRFYEFLSTISNGVKRGAPRPDRVLVDKAVKDTEKHLFAVKTFEETMANRGTPRHFDERILQKLAHPRRSGVPLLTRNLIRDEVNRTVLEVYGTSKMDGEDLYKPRMPSPSATYVNTRGGGGSVGALINSDFVRDAVERYNGLRYDSKPYYASHSGRVTDPVVETISLNQCVHGLTLIECIRCTKLSDFPRESVLSTNYVNIQSVFKDLVEDVTTETEVEKRFSKSRYFGSKDPVRLVDFFDPEEDIARVATDVKLVGLAEALKVRVISAGSPFRQFLLQPVQSFLWSKMSRHPAFQLTGKPVDSFYVSERLRPETLPSGEFFVSGDYSDATNQFKSFVSECCAEALINGPLSNLPDSIRTAFRGGLTGHTFDGGLGVLDQQTGQLMGSVVSFPVLCLVNATIVRLACELGSPNSRFSLRQLRGMFNGDDCLFSTTWYGYKLWQVIGAFCGLSESIGKTYVSRSFVQVNSTNFLLRDPVEETFVEGGFLKLRKSYFHHIKFINWGLVKGFRRSEPQATSKPLTSIQRKMVTAERLANVESRCTDLVTDTPDFCLQKVMDIVRKQVREMAKELKLEKTPYYLPQELGGLGVTPPVDWNPNKDIRCYRGLQSRGYSFSKMSEKGGWQFARILEKRFPNITTKMQAQDVQPAHENRHIQAYSNLIASVFLSTPLDQLLKETKSAFLRELERRERDWVTMYKVSSWPSVSSGTTVVDAMKVRWKTLCALPIKGEVVDNLEETLIHYETSHSAAAARALDTIFCNAGYSYASNSRELLNSLL